MSTLFYTQMFQQIYLQSLYLESGIELKNFPAGVTTYGKLSAKRDNVIWICHGLTANSEPSDWWSGIVGQDRLFDPNHHFIVCVNALGSCYGSYGPCTESEDQAPLLDEFPIITTRDQARFFEMVRSHLQIPKIDVLIGASLGGQQALEWAIVNPEVFNRLVLIATNAKHSAYGIAFNESQRLAIELDPSYGRGRKDGGRHGLAVARSIAMLSYRSYDGYESTQSEQVNPIAQTARASSYQRYQGYKLANRFCPYAYVTLSKAMDSHDVARGRNNIGKVLSEVTIRTLIIGVHSDVLFPINEQKRLSTYIPNADYGEIQSVFGHDGFLIESEQLHTLISEFLNNDYKRFRPTIFKRKRTTVA